MCYLLFGNTLLQIYRSCRYSIRETAYVYFFTRDIFSRLLRELSSPVRVHLRNCIRTSSDCWGLVCPIKKNAKKVTTWKMKKKEKSRIVSRNGKRKQIRKKETLVAANNTYPYYDIRGFSSDSTPSSQPPNSFFFSLSLLISYSRVFTSRANVETSIVSTHSRSSPPAPFANRRL